MNNLKNDLRKKAESLLIKSAKDVTDLSKDAVQRLVYELQVHQIELEIQNEDLKNMQHDLMLSYENYALLYNASPIGYLTLNQDGVILKTNPAADSLLAIGKKQDVSNKKLGQFIHPEDQDGYHLLLQAVLGGAENKVAIFRHKEPGSAVTLDCHGFTDCECIPEDCRYNQRFRYLEFHPQKMVNDNGEIQIFISLLSATDIRKANQTIACLNEKLKQKLSQQSQILSETNQKLAKKVEQLSYFKNQVIERERKTKLIFDSAMEGIISFDETGQIRSYNSAVETIFGYVKEVLIHQNIAKIIPVLKTLNHGHYHAQKSTLSRGLLEKIGNISEAEGITNEGVAIPLEISLTQYKEGQNLFFTCIVRDVTERKSQEQRDKDRLDSLAHVVRLGLMGEMASGIAHEVNQPLTAITCYSQVCLNLIKDSNFDKDQLSEILVKTNQQALKAGQIIHRLRAFVKSKTLHTSTVHINDLIAEAAGLSESAIKQENVELHMQLSSNLPAIAVDCIQIEQVVLNLIKNSVDSLSNLSESKPRKLSIQTCLDKDGAIQVRIKDNGPGIPESEQDKILTPFYTTKSEGMGMGLSICRSIVEAHEGVLHFNSMPYKGTTFYFPLPVAK